MNDTQYMEPVDMGADLGRELAVERESQTIIMVAGVGGAGGNAVNHMWNLGIEGVDFMVCNTDRQALSKSPVELKVVMGDGLGAGNDPNRGREAAIDSLDEIRRQLEVNNTQMLFIAAGMGGGTGTGAAPVIAKLAHEMGILTVAIVTTPDPVEGQLRFEQAARGVEELRQYVDSLLVISNEKIAIAHGELTLKQAFNMANGILASAAKGIAEIVTIKSDLVNVDFADVKRVMTNSGYAHLGVGREEGENRAEKAIEQALASPLLGVLSIVGAKNILLNIAVSESSPLKMQEQKLILKRLQERASGQREGGSNKANIIWGTSEKKSLGDAMEVVVVITGFDGSQEDMVVEEERPKVAPVVEPGSEQAFIQVPDTVTLGVPENPYADIEKLLNDPAYRRRNVAFVTHPAEEMRKEVLKEEHPAAAADKQETGSASLFDDLTPKA